MLQQQQKHQSRRNTTTYPSIRILDSSRMPNSCRTTQNQQPNGTGHPPKTWDLTTTTHPNNPKVITLTRIYTLKLKKYHKGDTKKYPRLCTRIGKSKNCIAKSIFKQNHIPNQQKGRRVTPHLLEKVELELEKLIQEKQIIKLENCSRTNH